MQGMAVIYHQKNFTNLLHNTDASASNAERRKQPDVETSGRCAAKLI